MRYVCLILWAALFSFSSAQANPFTVFRTVLVCESCRSYTNMFVDLQDSQRHTRDTAPVDSSGSAEFRGVSEGTYLVTVRSARGDVIHRQFLTVNGTMPRAVIRLPKQPEPERPVSGLVSVSRLQHKIPKEAKKEFKRADKAWKKGRIERSIEHLKKAIEIDPEYMEAYNNLGSRYIDLKDPKSALAAYKTAAELEPSGSQLQVNIAIALMSLRDYPAAELAARRAVDLNAADMKARFVLGLSLYSQRQFTNEAIDQLKRVQDDYPTARIALAAIQANRGEVDSARESLNGYLRSGHQAKRQQAQQMLTMMAKN